MPFTLTTPRYGQVGAGQDGDEHGLTAEEEREAVAAAQQWPALEADVKAAMDDATTQPAEREALQALLETYKVGVWRRDISAMPEANGYLAHRPSKPLWRPTSTLAPPGSSRRSG